MILYGLLSYQLFLKNYLEKTEDFFFLLFGGEEWTELSRGGMDLVIVRKNGLS